MLGLATTVLLLAALSAATPPPAHRTVWRPRLAGRIMGGHNVDISDAPWQLSIENVLCGASVISNTWALTAAHCVVGLSSSGQSLRAGSSKRGSGGSLHAVSAIVSHESYDESTIDYDIAVIQVSDPFRFGNTVQPVALPSSEPSVGTTATVTGWGDQGPGGGYAEILQGVDVQIVDRAACSAAYAIYGSITDRMICAGVDGGGKDACGADSGGPLVAGSTQVGIVSWGYSCGLPDYPGVYTNVANLRAWIQSASAV